MLLVFGKIFSFKDDSNVKNCCVRIFNDGKIIIINKMIPIPPIQWVNCRQKRIDFGKLSIFVRIEAPVVVIPLVDSKKALKKFGIAPPKR